MEQYIVVLKQSSASCQAIIFNRNGNIINSAQNDLKTISPREGWVEIDPLEIWSKLMSSLAEVLTKSGIRTNSVLGIGIINQRETTILWDKVTGEPVYNAISWSDRRTQKICHEIKNDSFSKIIHEKTGIVIDPYFSATKIQWIIENIKGVKEKIKENRILFGTVDSWIVWKLTNGRCHITDYSNASRTMLFNIHTLKWDDELLNFFGIPKTILPEVKNSSDIYDFTDKHLLTTKIPIVTIISDQHASLYGNLCFKESTAKVSINNGAFLLANVGSKPIIKGDKLLTTIAWGIDNHITYALEGSILAGGYILNWLKENLNIAKDVDEIIKLANRTKDSGNITIVPTFLGMGAPYWIDNAQGVIYGLQLNTKIEQIARAAIESISLQINDIINVLKHDYSIELDELNVDGIYSIYDIILQYIADLSNLRIKKNDFVHNDIRGSYLLACRALGMLKENEIKNLHNTFKEFIPKKKTKNIENILNNWEKAVQATKYWTELK